MRCDGYYKNVTEAGCGCENGDETGGANLEFGRYLHQANSPSNTGLSPHHLLSLPDLHHATVSFVVCMPETQIRKDTFAAPPHGLKKLNDQPELQAVPRGRGVFEADGLQ